MRNERVLTALLAFGIASASFGQRPDSPQSQKPSDGDVVRITTNLVQVDAVITDKDGKLITDLKPEELQLLEDNRPQKITHFSFIPNNAGEEKQTTKPNVRDTRTPGMPPERMARKTCDERSRSSLTISDSHFRAPTSCDAP